LQALASGVINGTELDQRDQIHFAADMRESKSS
jgi:hypothetical protein